MPLSAAKIAPYRLTALAEICIGADWNKQGYVAGAAPVDHFIPLNDDQIEAIRKESLTMDKLKELGLARQEDGKWQIDRDFLLQEAYYASEAPAPMGAPAPVVGRR